MSGINVEELIELAEGGDESARNALLRLYRDRLKRMVGMRMDKRVSSRFDPSDVVQEALLTASNRLSAYLADQRIPFYPWLRNLTWEHLLKMQDRHLKVQKRTVDREVSNELKLNEDSVCELVDLLAGSLTSPSLKVMRDEMCRRIRDALMAMRNNDREVLELLYLEQLTSKEAAEVLQVTQTVIRTRHCRAIQRLSTMLQEGQDHDG